jgi:Protein of unknown function (DUF1269)
VDADDEQEFIDKKTAEGVVAGGAVDLLFGPAGLAVGLVGGGLAGGVAQERNSPHLRSAFFDEVRRDVPEGSSAVIVMAAPDHVDATANALESRDGRLVRHHLSGVAREGPRGGGCRRSGRGPAPDSLTAAALNLVRVTNGGVWLAMLYTLAAIV